MNLYLVTRTRSSGPDYDVNRGYVIAASGEMQARNMAGRAHADEGSQIWFEDSTTVRVVGVAGERVEPGVVLTDFRAG